jgi:hypothetical protein
MNFLLIVCPTHHFVTGAAKRHHDLEGSQKIADELGAIRFHRGNTFGA